MASKHNWLQDLSTTATAEPFSTPPFRFTLPTVVAASCRQHCNSSHIRCKLKKIINLSTFFFHLSNKVSYNLIKRYNTGLAQQGCAAFLVNTIPPPDFQVVPTRPHRYRFQVVPTRQHGPPSLPPPHPRRLPARSLTPTSSRVPNVPCPVGRAPGRALESVTHPVRRASESQTPAARKKL